ncbi:hypothetical protein GCM10018966_000540 [Streptomyces yanii]
MLELEAVPVPNTSVVLVTSVPVPEVPRARLYVLWPPRVVSYSWYVEPDRYEPTVTVPE